MVFSERPGEAGPTRTYSTIVVDDHPLFAQGIARLLGALPDFEVVAICTSALAARETVERLLPDLMITDIDMPEMEIFSFLRRLRRDFPRTATLVVSALSGQIYSERVIQAGAMGFIGKDAELPDLENAVRVVTQGGIWMPKGLSATGSKKFHPASSRSLSSLSSRELEVFRHMGRGRPTREIAEVLHISSRTVATHRLRIYRKLGVSSTGELMRLAQMFLNGEEPE